MSNTTTAVRPISPTETLLSATLGVPEWIIDTINTLLVDAMSQKPMGKMSLEIEKSEVEAWLSAAAKRRGLVLDNIAWENFPYFFAEKWNIKVPPADTAGLFGYDTFYTFAPKGISQ